MKDIQTLKKGEELTLNIESMSFGGQGVGRHDEFVVFVDGAIPGDTARVLITKKKKNFAEARNLKILSPSPHRIKPVCPYFGVCGGCRMQDVEYETQLEFKRRNVADVFERLGTFEGLAIPKPIGSPDIFHYRNKMEFSFGDRPWLSDTLPPPHPTFALGLHVPRRFDKVLDIRECHLHPSRWSDLINTVRGFALQSGLPAYSVKTQSGFWRFLVLRRSQYSGHWMVQIITTDDAPDILNNLKSQLILNFPEITSLIHGVSRKPSQIAVSDYERVLFGSDYITEHIGSLEFEISSNAFFQTNTQAAEVLYGKALELADFRKTDTVLDLYCGTGTISLFVAPHVKEVVGYELVENAVQNARKNAIHNNISNCSFISGDLRQVLKNTKTFGDVVILDPPRAGLHEEVVQTVLDLDPRTILYISCNPSTQARDVALFCNGPYRLTSIQPVDMFPHTYHIENIVRLERTYGL